MKKELSFRFDLPFPPDVTHFTLDIGGMSDKVKVFVPAHFASDAEFMKRFLEDFNPPPVDKEAFAKAVSQCEIVVVHITPDGIRHVYGHENKET